MDLGELDCPEPPLFFQTEPEEIDYFIDPKPNAISAVSYSLFGGWSESHSGGNQSGGFSSFLITGHNEDGTFEGSGVDADQFCEFTIVGRLDGVKIAFTKFSALYHTQRYVGNLDVDMGTVVGKWGPPGIDEDEETDEATTVSIVGSGAQCNPEENMDEGNCEGPLAANQGRGFTLVRRSVEDFFDRPSDAELHENRPKALWKMVRNAAKQWYSSRHLTWDVLRERRDLRNRFMDLFLEQEEAGRLSDAFKISEWARICRQTHPNDLHLWRAIARYKQRRSITHPYVQGTLNLLRLIIKLTH